MTVQGIVVERDREVETVTDAESDPAVENETGEITGSVVGRETGVEMDEGVVTISPTEGTDTTDYTQLTHKWLRYVFKVRLAIQLE